ncbi:CPBP family intramembrane glutamic endopeptidase [Streptomyces lancefieldiae]|uniref:CPBP family intramembrane glutamic endopeptidase n=1 Tax=Streptomyces lancefieldiae TaxID=3075520 RepID=A0ABU3B3C9_9ACTN|nr:CPBP family intramembrane glutamic endopeptidase [Streptomyces sp. DSM 40712]MDT0615496.1 CPBP family intramembrane glutamic endopeptidase [Streptomyces sp. DSM 40712]
MSTTRTAPPQPTRREGGRFFQSPLVWMLTGIVGVGVASGLVSTGGVVAVVGAVVAVAVYWAVMRFVARRSMPEIAKSGAVTQALSGVAIGFGFITVSILMLLTEFSFTERSGSALSIVASMAAMSVGAAVTEELLFRGLALQALEKLCGSWAALAITAALFGGLHLANPDATLWSSTAIAIEAGVLLGAAFLWTRNIWFVVGLHFAWNTTLGLIGIPVSGHASEGLMTTTPSGPDLLTGGEFGLEASIVPVIVSLLIAIPMLIAAHRRGNLVPMRRSHG